MQLNQIPKSVKNKVITIMGLGLLWLCIVILKHYPDTVEHYYSNGVFRIICKIMHPLFNIFHFSVGDVFYIALIIYSIYAVVKLIVLLFKKRFTATLVFFLKLIAIVQILVIAFYTLWGLNYFRVPAAKRFNLTDTAYTFTNLQSVTKLLIDSANATRARLTVADLNQTDHDIYQNAVDAVDSTSVHTGGFPAYHQNVKSSLLSNAMNYLATSGDYNPFTSEAQINYQMPIFVKPFTACHEMSHQMGFGAEDEANFGGFIIGTASADRLLKYSAYYAGVEEFMRAVYLQDSVVSKQLKTRISPLVKQDFKTDRLYWKSFEGRAGVLSGILYDHYLKSNNQPQGIKTYNQMIRLVMAWYRKNALAENLKPIKGNP